MIPTSIISKLKQNEEMVTFGSITLKILKHDGHITRYMWVEESSEIEDSPTSGECSHKKQRGITENAENTTVFPVEVRK